MLVPMANDLLLTADGYEKLKLELENLKKVERQKIANALREAKSHGDLRENAMYHEAKLNQKRLEGRIAEIEKALQIAVIVERPEGHEHSAHLNSVVKLKDLNWGDEWSITLVGAFEADPSTDKISITSPLGAGVMGKEAGDEFEVEAPAGIQRYRVLDVS